MTDETSAIVTDPEDPAPRDLAADFARLGTVLLEAGYSATDTRDSLETLRAATAPETPLSFAVLPEAVFVARGDGDAVTMRIGSASTLSIHQSAMVSRMLRRLQARELSLPEALGAPLDAMRKSSVTHPAIIWIIGSALISAGLAILFRCPWWAVALSLVVGAIVGGVTAIMRRVRPAAAIVPFVAALLSTLLVALSADLLGYESVPLFAVCAPVAILVPGAMITNALLELTAADIVTGASRLIYGLILLAFMTAGIVAGSALAGLHIDPDSATLLSEATALQTGEAGWSALPPLWFSWVGVVVLAAGIGTGFGADAKLTLVNVLVMTLTYGVLVLLTPVTGTVVATGIAAAALFAVARLVEHLPVAIPASATFQPAFLLLVPGTVGLVALATRDPEALSAAPVTFLSLCIGTKVGSLLADTRWTTVLRPALRGRRPRAGS